MLLTWYQLYTVESLQHGSLRWRHFDKLPTNFTYCSTIEIMISHWSANFSSTIVLLKKAYCASSSWIWVIFSSLALSWDSSAHCSLISASSLFRDSDFASFFFNWWMISVSPSITAGAIATEYSAPLGGQTSAHYLNQHAKSAKFTENCTYTCIYAELLINVARGLLLH